MTGYRPSPQRLGGPIAPLPQRLKYHVGSIQHCFWFGAIVRNASLPMSVCVEHNCTGLYIISW